MSVELELKRLSKIRAAAANKPAINRALSRGCEQLIRSHFREVSGREKNKLGAKSSFWAQMIRGTKGGSDSEKAFVDMPRPIAQRRFGGTLKPTGTRSYLTIPIAKIAYGKSAAWFGDEIEVYTSHRGNKFLIRRVEKRGKPKLEFLYLLKKRVTQRENKGILPTRDEITANMADSFKAYMASKK